MLSALSLRRGLLARVSRLRARGLFAAGGLGLPRATALHPVALLLQVVPGVVLPEEDLRDQVELLQAEHVQVDDPVLVAQLLLADQALVLVAAARDSSAVGVVVGEGGQAVDRAVS